MAEAIARARTAGTGDVRFESAGLYALDGAPATGHAVEEARRMGADASGHRARAVTRRIVADADEIYVMTADHERALLRIVPEAAGRVRLLDPQGRDVEDPYGGTADDYHAACAHIAGALEVWIPDWLA